LKNPSQNIPNNKQESVLAVLVLYEKEIEEAESFSTLVSLVKDSLNDRLVLQRILIYDNSKQKHNFKLSNGVSSVTYFHNPLNGGTAGAYSYAFELAKEVGASWLLLLDHDTAIPLKHLALAADELNKIQNSNVAALLPCVKHGDAVVSPALLNRYGTVVPTEDIKNKKNNDIVTAISSGTFINVSGLKEIMPFPKELWLDYVDHWIFLRFSLAKWKVISFNAKINHHLSIEEPSELSAHRIISILNGEKVFLSLMGGTAKKIYYLRIAYRVFKYLRTNPSLVMPMLRWLANRILHQ
jgi:glycosyltransferase involved in cell wall biosynthesis